MKVCASCGSEYQDSVTTCSDCGSAQFITGPAAAPKADGHAQPQRDTRRFEVAGTVDDPLSAERLSAVLEARGIAVLARSRRQGTVDALTTAAMPWWEIMVPEESLAQAQALIAEEQAKIAAEADENARAAEEEEAETEGQKPAP